MAPTPRWLAACGVLLAVAALVSAQNGKYAIKTAQNPPPKELDESIRALLGGKSINFLAQGKTVAEIWLRKEVPAEATSEQIKNGISYRELRQTEILGAIRFDQDWTDYRKQKIKAGVYTLRLGFQPMDGDHTGASMFTEFLLVLDASKDTKAGLLEPKEMIEMSQKTVNTGHPGVLMLFPNGKPAAEPQLQSKEGNHWVLNAREDITVAGKKAGVVGLGLTLVGHPAN
jgi:hypothetical protein